MPFFNTVRDNINRKIWGNPPDNAFNRNMARKRVGLIRDRRARQKAKKIGKYYGDGKYLGVVKSKRYKAPSKMKIPFCVQNVRELRGTLSDPDGFYIGVGPDINELFVAWSKCLVHALFKEAGYLIDNWNTAPNSTAGYNIQYTYYTTLLSTTPTAGTDIVIAIADSYETIATKIRTALNLQFSADRLHKFNAFNIGVSGVDYSSRVDMDRFVYKVFVSNNMLIQNRSLAGVPGDPAEQKVSEDVVSNNPIHCRFFNTKGNVFLHRKGSNAPALLSWADPIITRNLAAYNEIDRHIDSTKFLNSKPSKSFVIDPGQIKNIRCSFSETIRPLRMYHLFAEFLNDPAGTNYDRKNFGKSALVGIDKMLKATSTENPVELGYELNTKFSMGYKYSKWVVPQSTFTQTPPT